MLVLRSERVFFAVVKQQVLADSGEHLRRDVEERGDGVEREMLYDAGAATEQLVVTLMRADHFNAFNIHSTILQNFNKV